MPAVMKNNNEITVMLNGQVYTVEKTHFNYDAVVKAVDAKNWDVIPDLSRPQEALERLSDKRFWVEDGNVYFDNDGVTTQLPPSLERRLLADMEAGSGVEPLLAFYANHTGVLYIDSVRYEQWFECAV